MQVWPSRNVAVHTWIAAVIAALGAAIAALAGTAVWVVLAGPALGLLWHRAALQRFRRRRALLAAPFPAAWQEVLDERVAFYRRLTPAGQARFRDDVAIFLAEQRFFGPQQSSVPEDIRVLIAAGAAMLGHGRPGWEWPTTRDIIVHVTNFNEDYEPGDHHDIAGMVHAQGPMLLSRKQVRFGFKKSDGTNVAVHELAHVIDMADGFADGAPSMWASLARLGRAWCATASSGSVAAASRRRCAPTPAPTRPSCSRSPSRPSSRRPTSCAPATRSCSSA
jgi:hypothetical protein